MMAGMCNLYHLYSVYVCTWAQDERPADLHMAQPIVPVSKTGHFPPARLVCGVCLCPFVALSVSEGEPTMIDEAYGQCKK
jgi:hypothetical protein